jgi:DNA polymerase-3 subunit delta
MSARKIEDAVLPVYAIFGPEAFLKHEHVARVIRTVLGEPFEPLALSEYDGPSADLASVLDDLRTLPFLSPRRLVMVRSADAFLGKEANREALSRYLESPSDSGVLLLVGDSLDARLKVSKIIQRVGEYTKCEVTRQFRTTAWVAERAAVREKRIDPAAARALTDLVGNDLAVLDNEIEKLSLYSGESPSITHDHVVALVGLQRDETVFGITDAIADGDAPRAMQIWEQAYTMDASAPARAVGGLAWGLRRLLDAKIAVMEGEPVEALARKAWTDPDRLRSRLDRWSLDALQRQLDALLAADLAVKTGVSTPARAIERFIVEQCYRTRERKVVYAS